MSELSTPTPHPRTLLYGDLIGARGERSPRSRSLVRRATDAGWGASAFLFWPGRAALLVHHAPGEDESPLAARLLPDGADGAPLCELRLPAGAAPDGERLLLTLEAALATDGERSPVRVPYEALAAADGGAVARQLVGQLVRLSKEAERMAHEATTDPMTALPTQTYLQRRLRDALLVEEPFALLVVDGGVLASARAHSYAERAALLRQLGALLLSSLGADDEIGHGRLPEEFMILVHRATAAHARALAGRIIASVHAYPWPLHVTLSIGIALYPDDGARADTLIRAAEAAAMAAKGEAREAIIFHGALVAEHAH